MNPLDYFQPRINYFWQWEEEGEVMVINGGSTIGYRLQIAKLLNSIAPQGLPPFGSFLMVLVATNNTLDDSLQIIESGFKKHFLEREDTTIEDYDDFNNCFSFLRVLNKLPQEYKTGKRREILLQTIFANCHYAIAIKTSIGVASHLDESESLRSKMLVKKPTNSKVVLREFKVLSLMYRKFPTVQSIINAMSDLPNLEEEELLILDADNPLKTDNKDFIDELISKPQTFEIGTLIKPIWAGFNVPIFNAHPSEQPLGGVSDLSNKGSFDKLLVSEFANDDLIFMSRIANNEALYLHREMPPVTDKLQRIILIDITLKSWGTPKILAFATYIAISKHPKAKTESEAFVVGKNFVPVSSNNASQVIDGLQNVDISLNPSVGLASFLEENKANKQLEIFYITTPEGLKYQSVQKILADYRSSFKYIITTNKDGEINFYVNKGNAQKHLQTIRLPLSKLWTKNKRVGEKIIHEVIEKPTHLGSLPMLLPTPTVIKKIFPIGEEVYIVGNRCLMKCSAESNRKNSKGWELCLKDIPGNGNYEIGKMENGEIVFLSFNPSNRELIVYNLSTGRSAKERFNEWKYDERKEFVFHADRFIKIVRRISYSISLIDDKLEIKASDRDLPNYDLYSNRIKELEKITNVRFNINTLKNIKNIYINHDNNLVFNGHQLILDFDKNLRFSNYSFSKIVKANAMHGDKGNEFKFTDGSIIRIDSNGYFTLRSSDSTLPDIYLTSTLESVLAMATRNTFAGNLFFYNDGLSHLSVFLEDPGANKLTTIKILRNYSGLGLKEVKELVDGAPQLIPKKIDWDDTYKMVEELKSINCITKILPSNNPKQEIISSDKFLQLYIAKFIDHILNHAASSKTI